MTAISPLPANGSVTSVLASSKADVMAQAMAVLLTRYESIQDDLQAQIADIETRNATKRLWNVQLTKLNKLMEDVAAKGKESNKPVEVYVAAEDLPYKDYKVTKGPDGELQLVPSSPDEKNLVSSKNLTPVYGPPGSDPQAAPAEKESLQKERVRLISQQALIRSPGVGVSETLTRQLADVNTKLAQYGPGGPIIGYKLEISADQVKAQTDNVRTQIDTLNTDSQIAMLRLNDSFGKGNLALEQMSKFFGGENETAKKILANF